MPKLLLAMLERCTVVRSGRLFPNVAGLLDESGSLVMRMNVIANGPEAPPACFAALTTKLSIYGVDRVRTVAGLGVRVEA